MVSREVSGAVKLKLADNITQRRCGEILKRAHRIYGTVCIQLRIVYAVEYNGVDLHRYIVLGYDRLRGRINDLFLERDPLCDFLDKRDLDMYSGFPRSAIFSEKFDYEFRCLRNDTNICKNENHDKCDDPRYYVFHKSLLKASYERMPPLLHRRCFAPKTAHLYGYYITYRIKNQPNGIGFYAKGFGMRKRTVMMMSNIRSARSSAETAFLMRGESFPVIPETAGSTM